MTGRGCALLLCAAACAAAPGPRDDAVAPAAPATLEQRLGALSVSDDDYYRPVLYTWTTPASITSLRGTLQLLVATAASGTFVSPFNRELAAISAGGGNGQEIAHQLTTNPALIRRRYAWPAPFATVMGIGPRSYGNALIRIELRPEAWIGRFDPAATEPFAFIDADGEDVAPSAVVAAPERIGAIFHVRTDRGVAIKFREYIVCNPQMVASWSVATPAIRAELDAEIALLLEVRDRFAGLSRGEVHAAAVSAWAARPTRSDPVELWHAALAFENERYLPAPGAVDAIIAALRNYDGSGEPLTVKPAR